MVLAGLAEPHTPVIRRGAGSRACVLLQIGEVRAADSRRHCWEAHLHHLGAETEGLEHFCAAIASDAGDAHLRHHLEQPRLESFAISRRCFVADRGEREIRMHRSGADRDQACDVMHVHRITGDCDDVGGHAPSGCEQVRMNRTHR